MRRRILSITTLLLIAITACAISFFTDKSSYGNWVIKPKTKDSMAWLPFYWVGDTLSGKYYDKAYLFVVTHINEIPNPVSFQFDIGDPYTELYSRNLDGLTSTYSSLKNHVGRLRSRLQFWMKQRSFNNLTLNFVPLNLSATNVRIKENYGDSVFAKSINDTLPVGTLGADIFKDRVLIIDYPAHRFAICDSVPLQYQTQFVPFETNGYQKVILPMELNGKKYRIQFDNGSSLFPLMTLAKNINSFSRMPDSDTILTNSWGVRHNVVGRLLKDSFTLAGRRFANVMVYANSGGEGMAADADGLTGNALFWNHIIIIDFVNKRFSIM